MKLPTSLSYCVIPAGKRVSSAMNGELRTIHGIWARQSLPEPSTGNIMTINGVKAIIQYDPDVEMYRGEFTGLNGCADFYGKNVESLKREGEISLKVFLDICQQDGVDPYVTGEYHS
jgi:hypothetical protein